MGSKDFQKALSFAAIALKFDLICYSPKIVLDANSGRIIVPSAYRLLVAKINHRLRNLVYLGSSGPCIMFAQFSSLANVSDLISRYDCPKVFTNPGRIDFS